MSRYINREDLLNNLKQFAPEHLTPLIVMLIEKQPTADVAEVVRCKECKYRGAMLSVPKGVFYTCKKYLLPDCKPDDYCSYGERMDGECKFYKNKE